MNYHDAQNLAQTLRTLRQQITGDEQQEIDRGLKNSPFTDKNAALCNVLAHYTQALREQALVDTVGLLRTAIAKARPLDAELIVLREYPLTPLERALISHLLGNAGRALSLCEFMQRPASSLPALPVTESYGAANEAEYVIASILREKLTFVQCTIAVTDSLPMSPCCMSWSAAAICRQHSAAACLPHAAMRRQCCEIISSGRRTGNLARMHCAVWSNRMRSTSTNS